MNAVRAKDAVRSVIGSPSSGVETPTSPDVDHPEREVPGDVLDLVGTHPPRPPRAIATHVIGCRVPPAHEYAMRRRAEERGVSVSDLLRDMIAREVATPADVTGWLRAQARQCDVATEGEALILVVRHLAKRWPMGCRLAD